MGYYDDTERKDTLLDKRFSWNHGQNTAEKKKPHQDGRNYVIGHQRCCRRALVPEVQPFFDDETGSNEPSYSIDSNTTEENDSKSSEYTADQSNERYCGYGGKTNAKAIVGYQINSSNSKGFGGGTQDAEAERVSVIFKKTEIQLYHY